MMSNKPASVYEKRIFLVLCYIAVALTANLFYFIGRSSLHWW